MSPIIRLVVYTVLIGEKETLNNPLQLPECDLSTDLSIDFICITDDINRVSNIWNFRYFNQPLIPSEKASRMPKAKPDEFFPDYEYSLYIDNTVVLKRLPTHADIENATMRGFRHPWRNSPSDEADIVAKSGLDSSDVVAQQVNFYFSQGKSLTNVNSLTAGTALLRRHNDERVRAFGSIWWHQILLFSKRDQLSLDLCAQEAGLTIDHFDGDKVSNDLFLWPVIAGGRRILGSFDVDRYVWTHRNIKDAVANPKKHFLESAINDASFERVGDWFGYVCERQRSSLGHIAPPRRGLSNILGGLLDSLQNQNSSVLVVGITSDETCSVDLSELITAEAALRNYFKYSTTAKIEIASANASDLFDLSPFRNSDQNDGFNLVIVYGLPKYTSENALLKFSSLLSSNSTLLLSFNDSIPLQSILRMHGAVAYNGNLEIFHGHHISKSKPMPNSVFTLTFDK